MNSNAHFYRPSEGHGLTHNPFNSIVAPRPIGWVSSRSADGLNNLAPYSFFNAFNYTPPLVGFASVGYKHSVANIEATGMFGWNLATEANAIAMNKSSASVDADVDEFELAGLTPATGREVDTPIVAEAPVVFECRHSQTLQLTAADGSQTDTWLVLGEVVGVHIDSALIVDGVFDTAAAQPILRGGGPADYFTIDASMCFRMARPDS